MEEVETLNASCMFEAVDVHFLNLTTSPSMKGSLVSLGLVDPEEKRQKLINVLSANLNKPPSSIQLIGDQSSRSQNSSKDSFSTHQLKTEYTQLKNLCIHDNKQKKSLQNRLENPNGKKKKCDNCCGLMEQCRNTRQALDDALQLTNILLKEVYKELL